MRITATPRRAAAAVAVSAAVLAGAAAPATAAEIYGRPADGTLEITGRGYGHGRGMSQYGAMNAAKQGVGWQRILNHYYPTTTLSLRPATTIRVGVHGRLGHTARIQARSGLVADDGAGQRVSLATADGSTAIVRWEIAPPTSGGTATTATLFFTTSTGVRKPLRSTGSGRWTITAPDSRIVALDAAGRPAATYVGSFAGIRSGSGVQPVVTTWMESYVRQVVPLESPGSWPVDALAAQTVAARTYATNAKRYPRSTRYDICDTAACQVFGGITAETANTRAAARATQGWISVHGGAPVDAQFGSSNGGQRVAGGVSYLPGTADPFETGLPATANQWSVSIPVTTFERAYPAIGAFTSLTVLTRDGNGLWGGRVLTLRLAGTTGSVNLTAERLRSIVGQTTLRSAYFQPTTSL